MSLHIPFPLQMIEFDDFMNYPLGPLWPDGECHNWEH